MPRYIVRYGSMRALGVLSTRGGDRFRRSERVVARTPRGLEVGEVLCEATEGAVARLKNPGQGQILRRFSADDNNEWAHIQQQEAEEFKTCQSYVAKLELPMQLVDIEHLFGGERIVVYYLSEQRVDFRELVKQLASEFQTRIEMRQIGVRDEAKLLADYGDCGKPVCCNTHLTEMPPVSMKMAKLQKATLDPTKISGRCGRLKCCLRYEYDTYEELHKQLPPIGAEIVTDNGRARVINQEILTQQLLIQSEDNRRMMIDAAQVLSVVRKSRKEREEGSSASEAEAEGTQDSRKSRDRGRDSTSQRGRSRRGGRGRSRDRDDRGGGRRKERSSEEREESAPAAESGAENSASAEEASVKPKAADKPPESPPAEKSRDTDGSTENSEGGGRSEKPQRRRRGRGRGGDGERRAKRENRSGDESKGDAKGDARRNEGKREENKREENKREENKREENKREENKRDGGKRNGGKRDDGSAGGGKSDNAGPDPSDS